MNLEVQRFNLLPVPGKISGDNNAADQDLFGRGSTVEAWALTLQHVENNAVNVV